VAAKFMLLKKLALIFLAWIVIAISLGLVLIPNGHGNAVIFLVFIFLGLIFGLVHVLIILRNNRIRQNKQDSTQ
jgi:hypothetical protein